MKISATNIKSYDNQMLSEKLVTQQPEKEEAVPQEIKNFESKKEKSFVLESNEDLNKNRKGTQQHKWFTVEHPTTYLPPHHAPFPPQFYRKIWHRT